ncbi:hypothetical protein H5T87_10415 [bacterium]|nr:hypothetical protein [bacterium]
MKNLPKLFLIIATLAGLQVAVSSENLLTNGGFEELGSEGFPLDWAPVGAPPVSRIEVSTDSHSGKYSLHIRRIVEDPTQETGLNRVCHLLSGSAGSMLSQLKGAFLFCYKIREGDRNTKFAFCVIPMSDKPLEDTGIPRRVNFAPQIHIGDGEWHRMVVTYDFSQEPQVKWVMPAVRIFGGRGELLLDDIEYIDKVGAFPLITKLTLEEKKGKEGEECIVNGEVQNIGDEVGDFTLTLSLPSYLVSTSSLVQELKNLEVKGFPQEVKWLIRGKREKEDSIKLIALSSTGWQTEAKLKLASFVKGELKVRQFILAPNQNAVISLIITNEGTAIAKDIYARISLSKHLQLVNAAEKMLQSLPPKTATQISWKIKALEESKKETLKLELSTSQKKLTFSGDIIIGAQFPNSLSLLPKPNASLKEGCAILSNDRTAIIFPRSSFGYGVGEIRVRQKGEWRVGGRIPYLARVIYSLAGERKELPIYASSPKLVTKVNEAILSFSHQFKDEENGNWRFQLVLTLGKGMDIVKAEYSLTCDRDRDVLLFEGPLLYVGEGSFGETKEEALFPGLEWLVDGERSSNSLDISEEHPDRIRYVPHPNKITIPLMSVYNKGLCLALLWNPYQKWDGANDRPSAVFASPDWFENRNSHLMGLFLPSVPQWVKENERIASTPYKLSKGKSLKLQAYIYATGTAKDSLSAMDKWFALFGVPEPMPIPRGNYLKEIEFSMNAYLHSLWVPEEEQWWEIKGGGIMARKGRPSWYLYDLYQGYLLSPSKAIRQKCGELISKISGKYNIDISGEDLGFTFSDPVRHLKGLASFVQNLLKEQHKDGSWRFYANRFGTGILEGFDYRTLGPNNSVEVGTCARNAWQVLRYARISGDKKCLESGIKALEFMKRFAVPRGAQSWEIPLHAPDVLAASDSVDAYIEGYRITRDKKYLEEAKKWARKALPFIYMWNDKKFPFMRYSTIIVFGASFHTTSWFGRPVQWCGLRLAYALLKLWDYDKSFPWKTVAEGLIRSAMYQQDEKGENIALWPDSIGVIKGDKASWQAYPLFSPVMILKCVYKLLDRDSEPQTIIIKGLHINYRGKIRNVLVAPKKLLFNLKLPQGEPGSILIAGIKDKPLIVRINGQKIDFDFDDEFCWLRIKLPVSKGWNKIEIEAIKNFAVF